MGPDSMMPKRVIEYLSGLTVTQGRLAGQAFRVLPWQARFIRGAFRPGVESSAISVGRGCGKTSVLSGIAAATLDGPLMVPRGETVIVASSFEQARISFEHVIAFMGDKLRDRGRWKVWDTAQQARIEDRHTGARVRCVGSDPKRAHGLAPVLILADEGAQWPTATGEKMVAALRTAMGKQPHSRFVALGTRPADETHWFQRMLDGGCDYAQLHAADPDDPPFHKRTWAKANPSLPAMPDLERSIRKEAAEARKDGSLLASFKSLRLNLGVDDVVVDTLLDAEAWKSHEGEAERSGSYALGIDLGGTAAMSACAAYWPDTGAADAFGCFPAVPDLRQRGQNDGVGSLYGDMHRRGELIITGSHVTDIAMMLSEVLNRWGPPGVILCDRYREGELRDALAAAWFPSCPLILRGMGFLDGAEDVRDFRRAVASGMVTPPKSLLLRAALAGARVVSDAAGNSKLSKATEGGRKRRLRDDAVAALLLSVAAGFRKTRAGPADQLGVVVV